MGRARRPCCTAPSTSCIHDHLPSSLTVRRQSAWPLVIDGGIHDRAGVVPCAKSLFLWQNTPFWPIRWPIFLNQWARIPCAPPLSTVRWRILARASDTVRSVIAYRALGRSVARAGGDLADRPTVRAAASYRALGRSVWRWIPCALAFPTLRAGIFWSARSPPRR